MAPTPGMFDPITLPKGGGRAGMSGMPEMGGSGAAGLSQPLNVRLGYKNEYGTDVAAYGDPVTRNVGIEAQFPIGGHRSGFGVAAQGGWSPETGVNASLRFGKTNRAVAGDEQVQAILNRHMERARKQGVPMTPGLQGELTEAAYNEADDLANGIGIPGREKYGFGLTVNGGQVPRGGAQEGLAPVDERALGELIRAGYGR